MEKTINTKRTGVLGIVLLTYLFLHLSFLLLISFLSHKFSNYEHILIVNEVLDIFIIPLVYLLPCLLYFKLKKPNKKVLIKEVFSLKSVPVSPNSGKKVNFALAAAVLISAVMLIGLLSDFIISLGGVHVIGGSVAYSTSLLVLSFVTTVILPCVCEEILCRGVVMREFLYVNEHKAVLFSSLVFALIHYDIAQFFYAFAAGLIIGYSVAKTRSLIFGIALHFVNNFVSFSMNVISETLDPALSDIVTFVVFGIIIALDIFALVFFLVSRDKRGFLLNSNSDDRGNNGNVKASVLSKELVLYLILNLILVGHSLYTLITTHFIKK